ncbi:MAG: HAMP domain-containing histidine kinase, partial [Bacteroidales bacterium]|nr:HAMP domain-containing histidine kinase [Bacteroidales bacterium]
LLLLLTRFITAEVVERIFRPLSEMSRKMAVGDVDRLEHIEYDQEDELTSLVQSYNRMVTDLSESTRRLAQAERDRTWTSMARQIAHEIKNPLTPIKLNLQMLIRMKEAGNPKWESKFDVVSSTILEHVDVLADTAEAFSSLAKMSSETPVAIDLDALLKQEVSLFSSREDIDIRYLGLEGAQIEGPKPQVTRVLVNIITNAVQALEGRGDGKILLSVRNSEQDGFYDIVVEDNGPGVKEEDREKIFSPEFTTKSSGSGLGLAICRAIIQRCQGTITCTKSFALGGASFIIRYPKLK